MHDTSLLSTLGENGNRQTEWMLYLKRDNVVNQESIHRTGYYVAIPHV